MSATNESVLSAIGEGAQTVADVVEATGFNANQVHQAVFALKKQGLVTKGADGYELVGEQRGGDANDTADDARAEQVAEAVIEKAAREPAKRRRKASKPRAAPKPRRKAKKRAAARKPSPAKADDAKVVPRTKPYVVPVEFARFGDYVVLRAGDVVELLSVMRRWSEMIEAILA